MKKRKPHAKPLRRKGLVWGSWNDLIQPEPNWEAERIERQAASALRKQVNSSRLCNFHHEKILATILAAPLLAFFAGVGILAWDISQTWDAWNTDALISGLITACSMGGIVVAGILAAIVGIPLAMRLMDQWRQSERLRTPPGAWRALPQMSDQTMPIRGRPNRLGYQEPRPPTIERKEAQGSWQSAGSSAYDLWDDEFQSDVVSSHGDG